MTPEEWADCVYFDDGIFSDKFRQNAKQQITLAFRQAIAEEREACAKLAEGVCGQMQIADGGADAGIFNFDDAGHNVANAIRARGTPVAITAHDPKDQPKADAMAAYTST